MKSIRLPKEILNRTWECSDTLGYVTARYEIPDDLYTFMSENAVYGYSFSDCVSDRKGRTVPVSLNGHPEDLALFCLKFGFTTR